MQRLVNILKNDGVDYELILLIRTILAVSKEISFRVSQGALSNVLGSTLSENVQGETQKHLDVLTNNLLKEALLQDTSVKCIASEEETDVVPGYENGRFCVAFDPLDGSSNIDINGQIGTIFTIYPSLPNEPSYSHGHFLQGGRKQCVAGYILYGPSTQLVMTTGGPTRGYTLDLTHGGYLLTTETYKIAEDNREFAINLGNYPYWDDELRQVIDNQILSVQSSPPQVRWNAAMVGDVHRVIERGGVFCYPADNRTGMQNGKLRLLYEANPMAWLVEQAGGAALNAEQPILDTPAQSLHQRASVVIGTQSMVALF